MTRRLLSPFAWSLGILGLVLTALTVFLIMGNRLANSADALYPLDFVAFSFVGAFIAAHRPRNPIGWLFCLIGLSNVAGDLAQQYAVYGSRVHPGTLPGAVFMYWVGTGWMETIGWAVMALLVPLLFPSGRLISPRWRVVALAGTIAIALNIGFQALAPGPDGAPYFPHRANPFGVPALQPLMPVVTAIGMLLIVCVMAASVASLVLRYRDADQDEQTQIKWFAYAAALLALLIAAAIFNSAVVGSAVIDALSTPAQLVAVSALPVAAGVAILRHRLYDIDVVINRTLVYLSLSVSVAAMYILGVITIQSLFRAFTGQDSELAVAIVTLAIAALFNPWRTRVQTFIDRRFYRRKYDAARTLARLQVRLRDRVEIDDLASDLLSVINETMQPSHAAIWFAGPAVRESRA